MLILTLILIGDNDTILLKISFKPGKKMKKSVEFLPIINKLIR